jgi:hypothetical protein
MELNHRFLFVGQESLPLDHGTIKWTHWESHPDLKRAELVSSCWTMSPSKRKPWDSNPQVACATGCFQDNFLIRPDDFRLRAAGVGIEPTSRRSERPVLPLDDPAIVHSVPGVGIEPTDS